MNTFIVLFIRLLLSQHLFSGLIMYRRVPRRKANGVGVFYLGLVKKTGSTHFNTVDHFTFKKLNVFSYSTAASGFRGLVVSSCRRLSSHTLTPAIYGYGSASTLRTLFSHPAHPRWDQLVGERREYQTASADSRHQDSYQEYTP